MEVIYKKSIVEQVNDAIDSAKEQNKEIEKFQLNKQEWEEFLEYNRPLGCTIETFKQLVARTITFTYAGIAVECVN